ncbi:MAG: hypothetical protein RH948_04140 [Cyclobacteriaceae bacterium]
MGDNIYKAGLRKSNSNSNIIDRQMDFITPSDRIQMKFVPGNHDWNYMRTGGLKRIVRQEQYVTSKGNKNISFHPQDGRPGPVRQQFNEINLDVIFIDSQWFLQSRFMQRVVSDKSEPSENLERIRFWQQLANYIGESKKNGNDIIFVMHHPFYSIGGHGQSKWLLKTFSNYIPVLQLFPLITFGNYGPYNFLSQDIPHKRYQNLKEGIYKLLNEEYPDANVIFAAGHQHNLQYWKENDKDYHHLVSGSVSKTDPYIKRLTNSNKLKDAQLLFPDIESGVKDENKITGLSGYIKIKVLPRDYYFVINYMGVKEWISETYHIIR